MLSTSFRRRMTFFLPFLDPPFLVGERKMQEGRGGKLLFLALLPTRAPFAALLHQLVKAWGTHRFSSHGWPLTEPSLLVSGTASSFLNWPKTTHHAGFRLASFSLIAQGLFRDSVVWTDAGQAFSQIESETSFSSQARFLEASPGPVWNASQTMVQIQQKQKKSNFLKFWHVKESITNNHQAVTKHPKR